MKLPFQKDEAFLDDLSNAPRHPDHFHLWWLGQSGFLLQWQVYRVLFDPYLSDSLTQKYAGTERPHDRLSERVVVPELLTEIDFVTSSHNHTDHLDAETLRPLFAANPQAQFICPEANRGFVCERLGCAPDFPLGLRDGQRRIFGPFTLHGIPAAHDEVERDEQGCCRYMGFVLEFGPWRIYHSGDTRWFDGLVDLLRPFAVDVALLPINGHDPARGVAGNLNAEEAARLGRAIDARLTIPHHYDMFAFNTADPQDFARAAQAEGTPYTILQIGEALQISVL